MHEEKPPFAPSAADPAAAPAAFAFAADCCCLLLAAAAAAAAAAAVSSHTRAPQQSNMHSQNSVYKGRNEDDNAHSDANLKRSASSSVAS